MKKLNLQVLPLTFILMLLAGGMSGLISQSPSAASWFQQTGFDYDSVTKVYSIDLQWRHGIVDDEHPQAEGYYLYRAMIGHQTPLEDYDLVATIVSDQAEEGIFKYTDQMMFEAGYFYYLIGYIGGEKGEMTPEIHGFSLGSYCVRMDAEIIDFISFPETMGMAGEQYTYQAYAKHRSMRVQGWVRYHLVEGPEGMEIDNKTGSLVWDIPKNAQGSYYVEIKSTSDEDPRAESVQRWYIRIATNYEIEVISTSVLDGSYVEDLKIYPNPATDYIIIDINKNDNSNLLSTDNEIFILNSIGVRVGSLGKLNKFQSGKIEITDLPQGVYFIRIGEKSEMFVKCAQ